MELNKIQELLDSPVEQDVVLGIIMMYKFHSTKIWKKFKSVQLKYKHNNADYVFYIGNRQYVFFLDYIWRQNKADGFYNILDDFASGEIKLTDYEKE